MRKVFFTLGSIVVVAIAVAWYFIAVRLDTVVESRIERAASVALGTAVEVGGVHTNLRDGTLAVEEISVANPPGFQNPYAVRLNGLEAAVDYDALEITRVVVENPEFIIEEMNGTTNFGQMLQTLDSRSEEPGSDEGRVKEPTIVIRQFRINETRATFESKSLDQYSDVEVEAIEMHDLRGTPSELAELIAREVIGELSSEAATEMLKREARKQLDGVGDKVSNKLRGWLGSDTQKDEEEADSPN